MLFVSVCICAMFFSVGLYWGYLLAGGFAKDRRRRMREERLRRLGYEERRGEVHVL